MIQKVTKSLCFFGFSNNNVISMSRKITSQEIQPERETTALLSSSCLLFVKQVVKGPLRFAERLLGWAWK